MSDATLLATAKRLIAKRGRTMTLTTRHATMQAVADKPWRGYQDESEAQQVTGVLLPLDRSATFNDAARYVSGELIRQDDQKAFVAGDVSGIEVGDRLDNYTVMQVRHYQPSDTSILWELWVRQ